MECGAVDTNCTGSAYRTGTGYWVGSEGVETTVRGTERNGLVGRRRTVCYNTVTVFNNNNNIHLTAIGLSSGGSGYFTCIQNMKLVTNKFKSGGLMRSM